MTESICYLSAKSRLVDRDGSRTLQILQGGVWVKVPVPAPRALPQGVTVVRSS